MKRFGKFLKEQDAFGHPVTINFSGEDNFKTAWGALLTLMQKGFILVVTILGVIDLFNYRDPNITQYSIFDKRTDGAEINFGQNYGGFIFTIQGLQETNAPIDPEMGYFSLKLIEKVAGETKVTQLSIDEFT